MADLEELAGRVEGLFGQDREVDALIAAGHNRNLSGSRFADAKAWADEAMRSGWNFPRYTASIDAAMTLVSGRFPNTIVHDAMKRLAERFALHMAMWPEHENYAEWLARFITAAALRSRTQGNQNG